MASSSLVCIGLLCCVRIRIKSSNVVFTLGYWVLLLGGCWDLLLGGLLGFAYGGAVVCYRCGVLCLYYGLATFTNKSVRFHRHTPNKEYRTQIRIQLSKQARTGSKTL